MDKKEMIKMVKKLYELPKNDVYDVIDGLNEFIDTCEIALMNANFGDDKQEFRILSKNARECIKLISDNIRGINELNGKIMVLLDDIEKRAYKSNLQAVMKNYQKVFSVI